MRCSNARALLHPPLEGEGGSISQDVALLARRRAALGGLLLLAVGTEFLALLAVQALGVGLLGGFERAGGARLLGLLFGGGGRRGRRRRGLRKGSARKQQRGCKRKGG